MPDYRSVLTDASTLSVGDRLRLIDELAATVPDNHPPTLSDEWLEEITRRSAEIESGEVQPEKWDAIRARLFAKHRLPDAS